MKAESEGSKKEACWWKCESHVCLSEDSVCDNYGSHRGWNELKKQRAELTFQWVYTVDDCVVVSKHVLRVWENSSSHH